MSGSAIGHYDYTYGAGSDFNRYINFFVENNQIVGEVWGFFQGNWTHIGRIEESQMTKEGMSTTEKMKEVMKARESGGIPQYRQNIDFSAMSLKDKQDIVANIKGNGYRITIANSIGKDPYFESINHLTFFDPR